MKTQETPLCFNACITRAVKKLARITSVRRHLHVLDFSLKTYRSAPSETFFSSWQMKNVQSCSSVSSVVDEKPETEREIIIELETIVRQTVVSADIWTRVVCFGVDWIMAAADRAEFAAKRHSIGHRRSLDVELICMETRKIEKFSSELSSRGVESHVQGCALNHPRCWCLRERPRNVINTARPRKLASLSDGAVPRSTSSELMACVLSKPLPRFGSFNSHFSDFWMFLLSTCRKQFGIYYHVAVWRHFPLEASV